MAYEPVTFEVVDRPPTVETRRHKWGALITAVQSLPEGKAVRIAVPEGIESATFRNNFYGILKNAGIKAKVHMITSERVVYVSK